MNDPTPPPAPSPDPLTKGLVWRDDCHRAPPSTPRTDGLPFSGGDASQDDTPLPSPTVAQKTIDEVRAVSERNAPSPTAPKEITTASVAHYKVDANGITDGKLYPDYGIPPTPDEHWTEKELWPTVTTPSPTVASLAEAAVLEFYPLPFTNSINDSIHHSQFARCELRKVIARHFAPYVARLEQERDAYHHDAEVFRDERDQLRERCDGQARECALVEAKLAAAPPRGEGSSES